MRRAHSGDHSPFRRISLPGSVARSVAAQRHLRFEPLESRHMLATITVNSTADDGGGALTTLREAISAAASGDSINFSVTGTIDLANQSGSNPNHLTINKNLTINGPGAGLLTIRAHDPDANGSNDGDGNRVFFVDGSGTLNVAISGLTLTNGDVGAAVDVSTGGAIYSAENLTLTACVITGNSAPNGGAIYIAGGTLSLIDSTVSGNVSEDGGGLLIETGTVSVLRSTFTGNYAGNEGGAIFKRGGNLTVTDSTVSGNGADLYGGGISKYSGGMTLTGTTISNNTVNQNGAGIYNRAGSFTVAHSTITGNQVGSGSGAGGGGIYSKATVTLNDSIVAGNRQGASTRDDIDGSGSFNALFSLIGDRRSATASNQGGSLIGTSGSPINALLGPLANNGGPTMTHALLAGSPAIDSGDAAAVAGMGGIPLFDQRGTPFSRVADSDGVGVARIDMGAYELAPLPGPALPGDYNLDGAVDAADYVIWRKTFGASVPQFSGADGNGDTMVDGQDYDVWTANFGDTLPPGGGAGDSSADMPPAEAPSVAEATNVGWIETSATTRARLTAPSAAHQPSVPPASRPDLLLTLELNADVGIIADERDRESPSDMQDRDATLDQLFAEYDDNVAVKWRGL